MHDYLQKNIASFNLSAYQKYIDTVECLKPEEVGDRDVFPYVFSDGPVAKISNSMKTSIEMWRGFPSFANGCILSGFYIFFQTSRQQKSQKLGTSDSLLDSQVSTHREGLRSWTGDMGWNWCFSWFFVGFVHGFWHFWAKVAKKPRKKKSNTVDLSSKSWP